MAERHRYRLPGAGAGPKRPRVVEVGWLLDGEKALFIWDAPQRVQRTEPAPDHAKAVNNCPAVLDQEARLFEIPCPIDIRLAFKFGEDGRPGLVNLDGPQASVRGKALNQLLTIVNRREWRHAERPIIQITTPYTFVADEPVWMAQSAPYLHFPEAPWPGVVIGGRVPIHVWPRQMMWAFEWFDLKRPLVLKRGDPWFYVRFEAEGVARPLRLVEAEMTPELQAHIRGMAGVTNYVDRTFSLFRTAEARRPKTLLTRKVRS